MYFKKFEISNFKGIQNLTLDLSGKVDSKIISLVGLNESGKTTILEALSFYYENLKDDDEIMLHNSMTSDVHSLIPKRLKANFNDEVIISGILGIEAKDKEWIEDACKQKELKLKNFEGMARVSVHCEFKNSKIGQKILSWGFYFSLRKKGGKKNEQINDAKNPTWKKMVEYSRKQIPPIIYYPNFLFEFPDKIYLEEPKPPTPPSPKNNPLSNDTNWKTFLEQLLPYNQNFTESKEQKFYRKLFQDILDSLKNKFSIQEHIMDRVRSEDEPDKDSLESLLSLASSKVTKTIFDSKFSNFIGDTSKKSINITFPKKDNNNGRYYVEFKLVDGEDRYYIKERSLGFRWFFTFLIFTQFRLERQSALKPFFLFDEPASNLHQTAQKRLLKRFENFITSYGITIIYTTHSHHLISPDWLENTFIVRNLGLDEKNEDKYTTNMTDVSIMKYRQFAVKYPDQRTYYQPILDLLEYQPSSLESVSDVIMTEGKNDYYTLSYLNKVILGNKNTLNLLPGTSASALYPAIQMYLAWGRNFIVLLDSDKEGLANKKYYEEKFGIIVKGKIFTLKDFDSSLDKKRMESMFEENEQITIQKEIDISATKFDKKIFNSSIQELLVTKKNVQISNKTKERFGSFIEWLANRLEAVKVQELGIDR